MKFLMLALSALMLATAVNAKDMKIGVINTQLIMRDFAEYRTNMEILESEKSDAERILKSLEQELKAEIADYDRLKNAGLTEVRSQELRDRIQLMQASLEDKAREYFEEGTGKIYKRQDELMEPLMVKVNDAIKDVAEEYGYDLILDNSIQMVVYANESTVDVDLTQKILTKLEGNK